MPELSSIQLSEIEVVAVLRILNSPKAWPNKDSVTK
jgi:hypothetical protein